MKKGKYLVFLLLVAILIVPLVSAGFSDWIKKLTGKASDQPLDINISVGAGTAPIITEVFVAGALTLNLGPSESSILVNFSVNDADGAIELNDNSVTINVTNGGVGRINNSACTQYEASGDYANYTCNVTMFWFDTAGSWSPNISISDNHYNNATNDTYTFTVNSLTGFVSGPSPLPWPTLDPGTTNQTANNWLTINNTGNQNIGTSDVRINATNLRGEEQSSYALWANNFSVGVSTGAAKPECDSSGTSATNMTASQYTNVTNSVASAGNFTVNDNSTGQEVLYFCVQKVGLELPEQAYSTNNEGTWTVKI